MSVQLPRTAATAAAAAAARRLLVPMPRARCVGHLPAHSYAPSTSSPRLYHSCSRTSSATQQQLHHMLSLRRPSPSMLATSLRFRFNSSSTRPPTKDAKTKTDSSAAASAAEGGKGGAHGDAGKEGKESFRAKLNRAWSTPTKWYPIPVALGALVLVAVQYRKQLLGGEPEVVKQRDGGAVVTGPDGPWQVRILGALPLRSMSRLWGYLNSLVLPEWFRPYGFKLYGYIFGCNMNEFTPEDLKSYESLGQFFYRELKPGVRPIADAPLVSPSDGRVLHCGTIVGEKVEQVKGMTYSLEALLGTEDEAIGEALQIGRQNASPTVGGAQTKVVDDEHFANINSIPYSLSSLIGKDSAAEVREDDTATEKHKHTATGEHDASVEAATDFQHDAHVAARLGMGALGRATDSSTEIGHVSRDHKLCFIVIYLAPGDYHRFHSPCAWVVERRRHFTGDLFSVSPYVANRLRNLFVLNERVALLGRWKEGFFSMVPVGATNVGSIVVNFDKTLRTNTAQPTHPANTFTEAVYSSASVLQGQPLLPGEEMGGFKLGSTIVLVFEAPKSFQFKVQPGDKVKVGEALGA